MKTTCGIPMFRTKRCPRNAVNSTKRDYSERVIAMKIVAAGTGQRPRVIMMMMMPPTTTITTMIIIKVETKRVATNTNHNGNVAKRAVFVELVTNNNVSL